MWVAVGHAAQYLWVTSYYARGSRGWHGFGSYYGKVIASGVAVWTLPVIAIAPLAHGRFEYETGIAMLLASVVNLHHFILDGAIWKLRQSKIASRLILSEPERPAADDTAPEQPWRRRAAWAIAAAGLAAGLYLFWVEHFVYPAHARAQDYAANAALLDRVAWLGRDSSALRVALARSAETALDAGEAERQLRRAFELRPSAQTQAQIGHLHARAERWEPAAAAFEAALALAPDDAELLKWAARAQWSGGHPERARELLERQLVLQPDAAILHLRIASLAKQLGDEAAAARHQREALRLEPGTPALRNDLAWTLATHPDAGIRDPAEAIRLAEALVREAASPDPNELDTLAAAYAAAGRFDEAIGAAAQAAALAAERRQLPLAETIRSREQLYRARRPYVEAAAPKRG
jgi:tetratricopeptide (TPR) repeat protein